MTTLDGFEFRISSFQVSIYIGGACTHPYFDDKNIYLPKLRLPKNATLHHVQDSICIALHSIGIDLTYKLDDEGQLTKFTFDRKIACTENLTKEGTSTAGNECWCFRTTDSTSQETSNDSFKFSDYKTTPVSDINKIDWIFQSIEK